MVLKDGAFTNMPFEDWEPSTSPKTRGSWNLHSLLPEGLDFFILLSSISRIVGSAGQANCAAGNTYMDALAHYRNSLGERAVALDLGAILDHGVLARDEALGNRILSAGLLRGIRSSEFLALLDHYCEPTCPVSSPHTPQIAIGLAPASELKVASPHGHRSFLSLPFYQHLFTGGVEANKYASEEDRLEARRRQDFISAETLSDAGAIVSRALLRRLLSMTPGLQDRIDAKQMDKPIQTFGVDSLQAIELRSWFAQEFAADIPIFATLDEETLATIGLLVARKSKLRAM
ncbi:KR domain-containing protein [Hypoxylon sp. NC0597]|nr:KR domain-containing protein [Hypoxylon sp. NC0597]